MRVGPVGCGEVGRDGGGFGTQQVEEEEEVYARDVVLALGEGGVRG